MEGARQTTSGFGFVLCKAKCTMFVTVQNGGSTGTGLFALDAAIGQVLWRQKISDEYDWSNAAYENGTVFVVDYGGMVSAFDPATGAIKWQTQLTDGICWFLGSAAIGGLYRYVSIGAVVAFSMAAELAAIPFFLRAGQLLRGGLGADPATD